MAATATTDAGGTSADNGRSTSSSNKPKKKTAMEPLQVVLNSVFFMGLVQILYRMCTEAFRIRLYAIEEYGRVIHEFDPYFNYRATEYLYKHGWKAFRNWFDYKVWYPLGRPVGTTIFPGMQVTAVFIKTYILPHWSINDICCLMPAWFGVAATLSVAWLAWECVSGQKGEFRCILTDVPVVRKIYTSGIRPLVLGLVGLLKRFTGSEWGLLDPNPIPTSHVPWTTSLACAVASASIMSIVPAHLLRSVGGGYDNESVAMTAMVLTFASWTTSLRGCCSLLQTAMCGILTGIAYFNMVAAWGGYTFVLNVIGVHAGFLVLLGRYSRKLWVAYSLFYIVGTALAIQVPVVGWTPLRSLEQIGPLVGFCGLQLIELSEFIIQRQQQQAKRNVRITRLQAWKIRLTVFLVAGAVAGALVMPLVSVGYFGPISSRVRGLFVKHTKTGNPLVDSVAEHQAASPAAYFQYLNNVMYLAPVGFAITALFYVSDASSFLLVYGLTAYFFSHKMVRLILLTAPIASCFAGIVLGRFTAWMFANVAGQAPIDIWTLITEDDIEKEEEETERAEDEKKSKEKDGKSKKNGRAKTEAKPAPAPPAASSGDPMLVRGIRLLVSAYAIYSFRPLASDFWDFAHQMAHHISHPSIIMKGSLQDGTEVLVDDYREAYFWLRDNTPEDARIMAWWDYGYQITGISERTTIADGNTWNHEHIAFLGRILTSPEKEAHRIARHLADYVLVWAGGGGDDLAKSPHLRRIANSVYRGLCSEPTCREFGFYPDRTPTEDMEESLLYKLVSNTLRPQVTVDPNRFKEVHRTRYGKVRIYKIQSVSKESKDWVADPANRVCDAPGSWVCRGQYPPALTKILAEKKDFRQLEDFNVRDKEDDSDYQREYMENLMKGGHHAQGKPPTESENKKQKPKMTKKLTKEDIELINERWENNQVTTVLWQLISQGQVEQLRALFQQTPPAPHVRSEDGRGPMWWAYEYKQKEVIDLLKSLGVTETRTDKDGISPLDLS